MLHSAGRLTNSKYRLVTSTVIDVYAIYPGASIPEDSPSKTSYDAEGTLISTSPQEKVSACYGHLCICDIIASSKSDSAVNTELQVCSIKLGGTPVLELKNKNIYILWHLGLDLPNFVTRIDAIEFTPVTQLLMLAKLNVTIPHGE